MTIFDEIKHVQRLAEAEAAGDPNAHNQLLAAIRKLQLAAEKPIDTTSRVNFQVGPMAKLLHAIAARNGEPITSTELSRVTDTDELLVVRVMRVLTAIGFAIETANQTYAANDTTHFEILPGSIAAVKHHFEPDFGMGAKLVEYMRGPGISQFADEPGQQTLFKYAHGFDKIFGMLEQNPEQKQAFDDYMASRRLINQPQWFEIYPAAEKLRPVRDSPDSVLLVDVGGGPGQEMSRFRQRHPDVPGRLILQDLPLTLNRLETIPEGIEPMEHDFFNPQPVKGARAYFFRQVLHNWSDAKSKQILSHIADVMEPGYSTLLIDDYVLPDTGAELRAAEMDILMWLHTAGLERTVSQWRALFDAVGLELVQIWNTDKGDESVLENPSQRQWTRMKRMMTSSARNTGEWQRSQPINRPEPGEFDPHPFYNQINLCKEYGERGLQVIVKLANIELTPEKPEYAGGSWHIEGQLSTLTFHQRAISSKIENISYEQSRHELLQQCRNAPGTSSHLSKYPPTPRSAVLTSGPVQTGHRKILAFLLVDPHLSMISSANVPPQQEDWWKERQELVGRVLGRGFLRNCRT
ncbi:hypothetical protein KXX16_009435 [Aspergillus fumigatus]|nr:hypothetical protein KXX16_009435 [Aspergillus fumigatus]KAH1867882.1 hypothetical protein KXX01_009652 [Aspergillus fumigatus]KAH2128374.1 hypothetical protein KXW66_009300 [Aspergillus fumigatus]KAH2132994.1 hypothetical protein KXV35_009253 [Aspergillus fumigatus]KAH2418439.1 hypothetical protein KXV44_008692 [Aspergillus fumigatus]